MKYRPDIDGLRALAVLLVFLDHFKFGFSGGFVGVDVFFVISGFVITLSIYPKIKQGKFKYSDFWYRRIRRLLPVLSTVLLTSILVFAFILLPSDLTLFLKNIVAVVFSVSNIFIWREYGGYFSANAQEAPMLHTWSLAVEEQYYLFWPLFLLILCRLIRNPKKLLTTCLILFLGSTYLSQFLVTKTIGAAYYLLPSRFFEVLCGSWIAILFSENNIHLRNLYKHLLSIIGLGLIIVPSILLNHDSQFPGYNALYPVLGTAMLIFSEGGFVNRILSFNPIVNLGKMSYSLYLWHWPVLVLLVYTDSDTLINKIIALFIIVLLSFWSWQYIEQPFRNRPYQDLASMFKQLYLLPGTFILGLCLVGLYFDGLPSRFSQEIIVMDQALKSETNLSKCLATYGEYNVRLKERCQVKAQPEKGKVLVIGDSHANHLIPFLTLMAKDKNYSLQEYTLNSCSPIFDLNNGNSQDKYEKCRSRNDLVKQVLNQQYDYVVLAAVWPQPKTYELFDESGKKVQTKEQLGQFVSRGLSQTVNYINATGAKVILVEDTPGTGKIDYNCPLKKQLFDKSRNCSTHRPYNSWFAEILNQLEPSIYRRINLRDLLCKNDTCVISINNVPLYRDAAHLNRLGSELIGERYFAQYGNIFDPLPEPNPLLSDSENF